MSIRRCSDAEFLKERVEQCIRGDMEMENFSEIDHIWIHSSSASLLGLGANDDTTRDFLVPLTLDIVISDRPLRSGIVCGVKFADESVEEIDLHVSSNTTGCFDPQRMVQNFETVIQKIGYARLKGASVWFQGVIAFVGILYAKASFSQVMNDMEIGGEATLKAVPFTANHPFRVLTSINKPLSVAEEKGKYAFATVDKNGWVVGERTIEEIAKKPSRY